MPADEITPERIERALAIVASLIPQHGPVLTPYVVRLEARIAQQTAARE